MTGYTAEQIVGCRACVVCRVVNSRILTARVVGKLGAVIHRAGDTFNLTKFVVGVGRSLTHCIGNGKRQIERVINGLANRVVNFHF